MVMLSIEKGIDDQVNSRRRPTEYELHWYRSFSPKDCEQVGQAIMHDNKLGGKLLCSICFGLACTAHHSSTPGFYSPTELFHRMALE